MTDEMMNLRDMLEKSADANLLREMIGFAAGRLLHHAVVVQIEKSSYRLRHHADLVPEPVCSKALITPPPAPKRHGRPLQRRKGDPAPE